MAGARPFRDFQDVLAASERIWQSLEPADWLEAFRGHPKIGEQKAERDTGAEALRWSKQEQAGVRGADPDVLAALAEGNRLYEERFGYIFIVCATGRTAEEMLALLRARLAHDSATESRVAAGEQQKITRLRLEKMLKP